MTVAILGIFAVIMIIILNELYRRVRTLHKNIDCLYGMVMQNKVLLLSQNGVQLSELKARSIKEEKFEAASKIDRQIKENKRALELVQKQLLTLYGEDEEGRN